MELWILSVLGIAGIASAFFGYYNRRILFVIFASTMFITLAAALWTIGYDSYSTCTSPTDCAEVTNITYDVNGQATQVYTPIVTYSAQNSILVRQVSLLFGALGGFLLLFSFYIGCH